MGFEVGCPQFSAIWGVDCVSFWGEAPHGPGVPGVCDDRGSKGGVRGSGTSSRGVPKFLCLQGSPGVCKHSATISHSTPRRRPRQHTAPHSHLAPLSASPHAAIFPFRVADPPLSPYPGLHCHHVRTPAAHGLRSQRSPPALPPATTHPRATLSLSTPQGRTCSPLSIALCSRGRGGGAGALADRRTRPAVRPGPASSHAKPGPTRPDGGPPRGARGCRPDGGEQPDSSGSRSEMVQKTPGQGCHRGVTGGEAPTGGPGGGLGHTGGWGGPCLLDGSTTEGSPRAELPEQAPHTRWLSTWHADPGG